MLSLSTKKYSTGIRLPSPLMDGCSCLEDAPCSTTPQCRSTSTTFVSSTPPPFPGVCFDQREYPPLLGADIPRCWYAEEPTFATLEAGAEAATSARRALTTLMLSPSTC